MATTDTLRLIDKAAQADKGHPIMQRSTVNKSVLLLVVVFISAIFLSMIRAFLMAIFLAGLCISLVHNSISRRDGGTGGRRALA